MSTQGRQTLRAAHLDRALQSHDAEIGQKMAEVLAVFHAQYVAPLEDRIAELETPWYERLAAWVRAHVERLRRWAESPMGGKS